MRLPRFRFTVRRLMAAVAIVGVLMVVESKIARWAIHFVSEGDGRGGTAYIPGEAFDAWAGANGVLSLASLLIGGPPALAIYSLTRAPTPHVVAPDPPEPE